MFLSVMIAVPLFVIFNSLGLINYFHLPCGWGDLLMALSLITDGAMRPVTSGLF